MNNATRGHIVFGNVSDPAILLLRISREEIVAEYHSGYVKTNDPRMYSTIIKH
jgi:hypothetical protein